jgi:hypothetical protein
MPDIAHDQRLIGPDQSNEIISFILSEVEMMHVKYCESFGVSIEEMQRREEHPGKHLPDEWTSHC